MNPSEIRKIIDQWGIRHTWLADKLGVSKTLLSLWFSEEREMPNDKKNQATKIIKELGTVPI